MIRYAETTGIFQLKREQPVDPSFTEYLLVWLSLVLSFYLLIVRPYSGGQSIVYGILLFLYSGWRNQTLGTPKRHRPRSVATIVGSALYASLLVLGVREGIETSVIGTWVLLLIWHYQVLWEINRTTVRLRLKGNE